jgi:hypothetical protein
MKNKPVLFKIFNDEFIFSYSDSYICLEKRIGKEDKWKVIFAYPNQQHYEKIKI